MNISDLKICHFDFWGKGAKYFVVGMFDTPLGGMYDFYNGGNAPPGVIRNPYPFWNGQPGVDTIEEAEHLLALTKNHMEEVLKIAPAQRVGSSKFWKQ